MTKQSGDQPENPCKHEGEKIEIPEEWVLIPEEGKKVREIKVYCIQCGEHLENDDYTQTEDL